MRIILAISLLIVASCSAHPVESTDSETRCRPAHEEIASAESALGKAQRLIESDEAPETATEEPGRSAADLALEAALSSQPCEVSHPSDGEEFPQIN